MWPCCGWGRKRKQEREPDERTALLTTDSLPFIDPTPPPRAIDDEALAEYQRRIERIIEEANEKITSVIVTSTNPLSYVQSNSTSDSSSSGKTEEAKEIQQLNGLQPEAGSSNHAEKGDTLWRAEKAIDGSIYSMKKVASANSNKGKAKAHTINANSPVASTDEQSQLDQDHLDTVASYRTAESGSDEDSSDDESGGQTPTGRDDKTTKVNRPSVQDIWEIEDSPKKQKAAAQRELDRALAMSEADFARLLIQPRNQF
ncbi:MAG: hypothetical protein CYPHOPRED_003000 [Cyphobasidiales sp. Tagirdzhanova-0007]|nr:MAG: hypothetical protein CYPHOPRED_003000 [Cyphobasidiales sp. Tagirdzhanova-0007]